MLRRKLLLTLFPLVLMLLGTAVAAIWMLQGVLTDLRHIRDSAWVMVESINDMSIRINAVEVHLYELQTRREWHLDNLIDDVEVVGKLIDQMGSNYLVQESPGKEIYQRIKQQWPAFQRHVGALATVQDEALARQHTEAALAASVAMRQETLPLSQIIRDHAHREQEHMLKWFGWLVLGLGLVFLLVINVAVIVLLRGATMVLRPIDRLMTATQELGKEHYDYRVQLQAKDEFGQLAQAYNTMAEQLQGNEKRRMETLGQVALAMNHEINNAVTIIDLQLRLMSRRSGGDPAMEKSLREIQASLDRMTRTVQALKNIRRIVLTDYISGVKMLDLEQSAKAEGQEAGGRQ